MTKGRLCVAPCLLPVKLLCLYNNFSCGGRLTIIWSAGNKIIQSQQCFHVCFCDFLSTTGSGSLHADCANKLDLRDGHLGHIKSFHGFLNNMSQTIQLIWLKVKQYFYLHFEIKRLTVVEPC
jgi:hypothetical protein